ncbi:cysteine--tRNA ligase [Buchnera aphidicola (Aphis craccivore)]|uniref:Cysteine--tRNA ligase n=1 Tax=Buchnera aphidicola (Aphis craccivora) TaxID=466616 RepID=A0AA95E3U7_9GAMM|nr:cysteine--tRNA ligase [Buchnera aphidicola]QLL40844.1 cysteine--tRNA ligase [Buchnera aphidicola (Aphis craccivore)]WAI17686.1 MAG: cysteine--tRNA ligase [Buchnera aphidicola (Aphis craccivora)]
MLKFFNTLTGKKEKFKPIKNKKINLYVCGVTVYDFCHIGHARTFVVFDMIVRYLRFLGFQVKYIRNITDIDDKIILKSLEKEIDIKTFTNSMIDAMKQDFFHLGIDSPDQEPRVTEHMYDIIQIIKTLIKNKHAYINSQGDVIFSIHSDESYGSLSRQSLKNLFSNTRITSNTIKKNPLDFVLWKKSKEKDKFFWESPWGRGRPGWHIECTAITNFSFKNHIDIHGGGSDLLFPHHENEISQSRCFNDKFKVNFWMHSGMVIINDQKMSKSLNNAYFLKDILLQYQPEVLRYFFLSTHYRHPIYYSEKNLKTAELSLNYLYNTLYNTDPISNSAVGMNLESMFYDAINDDFNTPEAFSVLMKIARKVNYFKQHNLYKSNLLAFRLKKLAASLNFLLEEPEHFLQKKSFFSQEKIKKIEILIEKRNIYRNLKLWKKADQLRNEIMKLDVILEDSSNKTFWKYKK